MKKQLQRLLLIAAIMAAPWATRGQTLSSYTLTVDTTTFNSITSTGTALSFSTLDDGSATTTLPFAFGYGENVFPAGTSIALSANGFIRLNATTATGTTASYSNSSDLFITALLQQDAHLGRNTDAGAYYQYDATAGTFTIEYHLLGAYSTPYGAYSYQVVLHSNGNIEFIYDSVDLGGATSRTFATYLTDGPSNDRLFLTGAWDSPVASSSYSTRPYSTLPAHGLRYTLTRPTVACPRPSTFAASNIGPYGFDLAWTETGTATSWHLQLMQGDSVVYDNVETTTTVSLTSLIANTPYTARVASLCDAGDTSTYKTLDVRTGCDFISTLPYANGFETDPYYSSVSYAEAFPYCWHRINDATGSSNYYPYITTTTSYVHSGTKGMYWYHTTTSGYADNEFAVLPGIDTNVYNISDLTLAFFAKTTSTSYHPTPIIGVMTDAFDASTFTPVYTFSASDITTTWQLFAVSLANYTGYGNYIAIKWPRPTSSCYMAIDDIFLTDNWCNPPQNITATSTTDQVTISWSGSELNSYTVIFDDDTVSGIASNSYTFTGLNPNTQYDYAVATECASSQSMFMNGSVRTRCVALDSLPYTMGFEASEGVSTGSSNNAAFVNCWNRLNNATDYFGYPYVASSSSYNHTPGGSRGLYWYLTTTTGTYGDYEIVVLPSVNTAQYPINTLQLKFWARATSASYAPVFQVGVMTDPDDASTFQQVGIVEVSGTVYNEYVTSLGSYSGTGSYVAVRALRPSTSSWYATTDDFTLEPLPSCPSITNLAVGGTTPGGAVITWSYMAGTNEIPVDYTVMFDSIGGTSPTTVTASDPYYTFTALTPVTTYKAYVRARCSASSYGEWDSITFSTSNLGCYALDPSTADTLTLAGGTSSCYYIPLNNFYNYSYTQQIVTAAEMGNTAATLTGIDFNYAYTSASTVKGNVTIYLANTTTSSLSSGFVTFNSNFVPVYNGPMNCTSGWNHFEFTTPFSYDGSSNLLIAVHDNSGGYDGSSYVFSTHSAAGKTRYLYTDSSPYDLNAISGGTSYDYRNNMIIYSGECMDVATCANPSISVVGVDSTSVELSWAPGYEETMWNLEYRSRGSINWDTLELALTSTSYTVTDLNPGTVYDFRVSHTCDTHFYFSETTTNTSCIPDTVPFFTSFENSEGWTTGTSGTVPSPCWVKYTNYSTSYYPYVTTGTYHSGSNSLYLDNYTYNSYEYLALPMLRPSIDSLMVSFWLYKSSSSYPDAKLQVGVMTDPNDFGTFTVLDEFVPVYGDGWVMYDVIMSDYEGPAGHIAFANPVQGSISYYPYMYLDDITVDYIPPCSHVNNVHATTVSGDTITIAWTPTGDETEWEVTCGDNVMTVTEDSAVFTGMRANMRYTFSVRAICSDEDTSSAVYFTTHAECGELDSLPFFEDFETARGGSSNSATFIPCWGHLNDGSYPGYPYVSVSTTYNHTPGGMKGIYWYYYNTSSYGNHQAIVLPPVDTTVFPTNNLMLSFWAKPSSTSYEPVFYAGVMSDPTDINTFYYYDTIYIDHNTTDWLKYTVYFDQLPDTAYGKYVAIRANLPANYWYAYVDDITLNAIPDCNPVEDVVISAGPTSAMISWSAIGSNYNGATLEYKESSSTSWNSVSVSGHNYGAITGLTPETDYDLNVIAVCDDGDAIPVTLHFTTRPYVCDVYDSTNLINTIVGDIHSTTSSNYLPSYSFYNYGYSQQFYTPSEINGSGTITTIAVMPTAVAQQRTFEIYMGYSADSSAADFITPSHMVCVYNDGYIPIVANEWLEFELSTPFTYNPDSGNLVVIFRDLTGSYVSGNAFLSTPSWSGAGCYIYQDGSPYTPGSVTGGYTLSDRNVMRFFGGTCLQPSTCAAPPVLVTGVGPHTVDIAWTPGNADTSWNLYYRSLNERNYTTAAMGVTTTSYQFTGLNGGTNYEFMVVPSCNESLSATVRATTECAPIASLPFTENFNDWGSGSGRLPNCWLRTGTYSTYTYISTSYNHSGSTGGSIYMYCSTGSYVSYIVLPELDTNIYAANQTQLVFYVYNASESYGRHGFEVGVMEDNRDASTFVPVDTVYHSGTVSQWEIFEVPLTNYTGNGANVAVRTLYTDNYFYPYLDDFTLEVAPTCIRPDSLTSLQATPNTVELSWHERGSANQWVIEYGPMGFELGTGTTVVANSNPFTLTGLPNSYIGEYYVKAICGAGDTSEYSREACVFGTTQIPATIPYSYNFEDSTEWHNWQTSSNASANWFRGTAAGTSQSMYISADSGATYKPYQSVSVVNASAFRDIDFGSVDSSFTLTFSARVGGTISNNYDGMMVMLVNPSIPAIPSSANITTPWGHVNNLYRTITIRRDTNWRTYEASFDNISGIHRVAFFWFNQNTQASYPNLGEPVAVDDININYSTCPRPYALQANPGTSSARLSWQGDPNASYEVVYRPYPNGTTNTMVTTNTNHVTITGLENLTQYAFWVRRICGVGDTSIFSDGETFATQICDNASTAVNYSPTMSTSTSSYSPIGYALYNYSYMQMIIDSAYMSTINGDIIAFSFMPTNTTGSTYYTNMTVYMANVPEDNLSSGFIHPDTTDHIFVKVIDSGDFNFTAVELQLHRFDTSFTWDGHSNVLFAVNREHGQYTSSGSFEAHVHASSQMRYVYNDGSAYNINTVTGGTASSTVGDITLIGCASISCATPEITSVTHDYQSATISWTGDGDNYEVNIKETTAPDWPATDIAVSGNTYTFSGLNPATSYTFRVRQDCNADSNGYSEWVEDFVVTDSLPCFPPHSLHVTDVTNATATFDWITIGNETMWEIHVWTPGDIDSIYRVTSHPVTVGGFTAGLTYNAEVRALCGVNLLEGDWSATMTFATAICPNVANVSAGNVTDNSALIVWDLDDMAESWIVEYGYAGFDQGSGTIVPCTANSFNATGLECETSYDFYVRAVCGTDWTSENWARVSFTTNECAEPCDAPFGVTATVNLNNVDVNWTPGEGNTAFEVEYGSRGFSHGSGTTVNATEPHATLTGLDYNTQYDLYVRALCGADNYSGWSPVTTFTTGTEGISSADGATCTIFPNPATNSTTISVGGVNGKVKIEVVDMNGRTVATETLECNSDCVKTMEVDKLAQGAYFVRISGEQVNMVRKLIVK